jgi:hypothetical protein
VFWLPVRKGDPLVAGDDAVMNGEDCLRVHPHPRHLQQGSPHTKLQPAYNMTARIQNGSPLTISKPAYIKAVRIKNGSPQTT